LSPDGDAEERTREEDLNKPEQKEIKRGIAGKAIRAQHEITRLTTIQQELHE
jgi:hypothetical protein